MKKINFIISTDELNYIEKAANFLGCKVKLPELHGLTSKDMYITIEYNTEPDLFRIGQLSILYKLNDN